MEHPHKIINDKDVFRGQVVRASKALAVPVAATLGPDGLPILIKQYEGKPPKITKDGVTVANSIFLGDPNVDTIIQAIKEASRKTNDEAGDGTTTAIVLTHAIIRECMKYITTGALSPQAFRLIMQWLEPQLMTKMAEFAVPVKTKDDMKNVAMISSNGDSEIAESVVKAVDAAGEYGMIVIEEGFQPDIQVEHKEGFRFKSGFQKLGPIGPIFITRPERQTVETVDPAVILYDGDLAGYANTGSFINALTQHGKRPIPLVIIAHSFDTESLGAILAGKRSGLSITPVKSPIYGSNDLRRFTMDDLSVWTGAKVIEATKDGLMSIVDATKAVDMSYLGSCKKFVMDQYWTVLYDGRGTEEKILERVKSINANLDIANSDYEREGYKHRLAMMAGGIVHISVGAGTEFEMKERKDRVDDALSAVKASVKEGIVPGGGAVFLRLSNWIDNISMAGLYPYLLPAAKKTIEIMKAVLEEPIRQLAVNVGVSPDIIVKEMLDKFESAKFGGWNAREREFCADMVASGIVDPLKVIKSGLKNAISISVSLLSGGGSVVYADKKAKEKQDIEGFYVDEKGMESR